MNSVSISFLRNLAACSTKGRLYRGGYRGVPEDDTAPERYSIGKAFHQVFFDHMTEARAERAEQSPSPANLEAWSYINDAGLHDVAQAWLNRPLYDQYEVFGAEISIPGVFFPPAFNRFTPDGSPLSFTTIIDLVVQDKTAGTISTWENKTTKNLRKSWAQRYHRDPQLVSQCWALSQYLQRPVTGALVNIVSVAKPPASNRTCKEHAPMKYAECGKWHLRQAHRAFTITQDDIDDWMTTTYELLLQRAHWLEATHPLQNVPREGLMSGACWNCDFRDWCITSNRNPETLNMMLTQEGKL